MTLFYGIKWHPQLFCLQKSSKENRPSAAPPLRWCRILEHHLATTHIHSTRLDSTPVHYASCSLWAVNCPSYRIKKKKLSWSVSVIWPELFREHRQMPFKCFNLTCPIKNAVKFAVIFAVFFLSGNCIKAFSCNEWDIIKNELIKWFEYTIDIDISHFNMCIVKIYV